MSPSTGSSGSKGPRRRSSGAPDGGGRGRGGGKGRGGPRGPRAGKAAGRDEGRGPGRSSARGPSAEQQGEGPGSGKKGARKRIPPPPPREGSDGRDASGPGASGAWTGREEPIIERVEETAERAGKGAGRLARGAGKGSKGGRSKGTGRRSGLTVEQVDFPGVAPATETKLRRRLAEAARAFESERFTEAARLLASIDRLAPGVPEVHELAGLTEYRLGRWVRALTELERFTELTGSVEQHPVMADCCRALKRWSRTEELWHELGEASPAQELVEEGRIVQAGALADRGRLDDAIRFMERAPRVKGRPGVHHLRRWYMLADLYERVGDTARARRLFGEIVEADASFGDAAERAAAI